MFSCHNHDKALAEQSQAKSFIHLIVMQFGLVHISAGDLLRAEVASGTPAGKEAASYMDSGNLVPNSVVVEMVVNRLSQEDVQEHGWLLDGYPRSGDQAEAIVQEGIKPDLFVLISVSRGFEHVSCLLFTCCDGLDDCMQGGQNPVSFDACFVSKCMQESTRLQHRAASLWSQLSALPVTANLSTLLFQSHIIAGALLSNVLMLCW